jgi:phosphonate C-P lyase system protein PhnH
MFTQQTFRLLMQAMSRPGTIHQLEQMEHRMPYISVLLTLLDHEVTFAVVGMGIDCEHITMATGARKAPVEEADYVIIDGGDSAGAVIRAKRGDFRYPEEGATLIYHVKSLQGSDTGVCLMGPGILRQQHIVMDGLSSHEVADIATANAGFPTGIDCIFVDDAARVTAVPRSVRMEMA